MADKLPTTGSNPLAGLASILQTLGGSRTTQSSNPGDTAALQAVVQQLQAQQNGGYEQLLQSIFQQASGQIPGLQVALGNSMGARSGNNSAMAAALQKLLQQTTLAGQQQIAAQQAQNLQTQTQAGQAIAQATRGTSTTQNTGTNMGQAAKIIAGLQLFGKARGLLNDEEGIGGQISRFLGTGSPGATVAPVQTPQALGMELGALDDMPIDITQPAVLPDNFDTPLDLDALFGGNGDNAVDLGGLDGLDFSGLGDNSDLGGWTDPMMDPNIDWSL